MWTGAIAALLAAGYITGFLVQHSSSLFEGAGSGAQPSQVQPVGKGQAAGGEALAGTESGAARETTVTRDYPGAASGNGPDMQSLIVKDAELDITVEKGGLTEVVHSASALIEGHGGYVTSSSVYSGSDGTAMIVARIPSARFERTLGELEDLGEVSRRSVSGRDVTGQVVDLRARLGNEVAARAVLLRLMNRSHSVSDTLQVQRRLEAVQAQIEQLRAQLEYVSTRTSFGTITLSFEMAGAGAREPGSSNVLVQAVRDAAAAFLAVVSAIIVGLGALLPPAALGAAGIVAYRSFRKRPAGAARS
jgi:hypothetical protein